MSMLNDLRARILAGEEPTHEELSKALALLRQEREESVKRSTEKKAPLNLDSLFEKVELDRGKL